MLDEEQEILCQFPGNPLPGQASLQLQHLGIGPGAQLLHHQPATHAADRQTPGPMREERGDQTADEYQAEQAEAAEELVHRDANQHQQDGGEGANDRQSASPVDRSDRRQQPPGGERGGEESDQRSDHQQVERSIQLGSLAAGSQRVHAENDPADDRQSNQRAGPHPAHDECERTVSPAPSVLSSRCGAPAPSSREPLRQSLRTG